MNKELERTGDIISVCITRNVLKSVVGEFKEYLRSSMKLLCTGCIVHCGNHGNCVSHARVVRTWKLWSGRLVTMVKASLAFSIFVLLEQVQVCKKDSK